MTKLNNLDRRTFFKAGGALGALAAVGGATANGGSLFREMPDALAEDTEEIRWTHCAVNCQGTCALKCHVKNGEITYVETDDLGDPEGPQSRACLRGRSIRRWLQSPDRLNYPMKRIGKRGEAKFERISWDEAIQTIASELKRVREQYGDEAVYYLHTTGVNSGNIGSNRSNCVQKVLALTGGYLGYHGSYSSAQIQSGAKYTYGDGSQYGSSSHVVKDSKLVVMFGFSPADTKIGGAGQGHSLAKLCRENGCRVVNIDYRLNDSVCNWGWEWLPIRPGTDGALVAGLAYELINNGWVDEEFLHTYCVGYDEETMPASAQGQNKSYKDYILGTGYDMVPKTPEWASAITLIPADKIRQLAKDMAEADPCFIMQGFGSQRHSNGEITARAIMLLPQLLGQIGKPGTNDGRSLISGGLGVRKSEAPGDLYVASYSSGSNPVKTKIPFYLWPTAVAEPEKMTKLESGFQGGDALSSGIKFIFCYAGNGLTNQHCDINKLHDILVDDSLCEFIVVSDVYMVDSAKYADILLPDLTKQEQVTVSCNGYQETERSLIFGQPVYEPKFERRSIYDVCADLARELGVYDEYAEGHSSQEEWLKEIYESDLEAHPDFPTWEEGMKMGIWKRDGKPVIGLQKFIADPVANPLKTPSGKIEIYSEQLADIANTWVLKEDEVISPIPLYDPGFESYLECNETYPLVVSAFHYKASVHSSYANNSIIEASAPHWLWINPVDAESRNIQDGDMCRVFNDRGEIRIRAKVTNRIIPGVVTMPQGKWHDADMDGDRIDHGGCINTLTTSRPSPLCKGNPVHTNIGQVEKVEA